MLLNIPLLTPVNLLNQGANAYGFSDIDVFQLIFFRVFDVIGASCQIETVWEYLTLPKKKRFEYTYD